MEEEILEVLVRLAIAFERQVIAFERIADAVEDASQSDDYQD
jgi:hypothetical protein